MSGLVADSFWSTPTAPLVVALLVGSAVFVMGWLLFGTAARARKDREMAARMASVTRPNAQPKSVDSGTGGWIPDKVTSYGKRFADARGFSERIDAELEAAGVSVRSGEFVVLSVAAALIGAVLGAALLRSPLLALAGRSRCGRRAYPRPEDGHEAARREAARAAPRRADDHGELAPRRPLVHAVARHGRAGDRAAGRHGVPAGGRRDPIGPGHGRGVWTRSRRGSARPTSAGPSSR